MIGIYKIVSPTNRVYIGQSVDIKKRFSYYKRLDCKSQPRLDRSLKKYGVDNHKFEIITECMIEQLNYFERFYQDYYNVLDGGLNCRLQGTNDKSGKHSTEHTEKMKGNTYGIGGKGSLGYKHTPEQNEANRLRGLGRKASNETKLKMSLAQKKKAVRMYKDGLFIDKAESILSLSKKYGLLESKVSAVCLGKRKTHKGYIFLYDAKIIIDKFTR